MRTEHQSGTAASGAAALPVAAKAYVSTVVAVSLAAGGWALYCAGSLPGVLEIALWSVIGIWAQVSILVIPRRKLRISPSTTVYLAMVLCLDPGAFLIPVWASVVIGGLLAGGRVWYRLAFNAAQFGFAALGAKAVLELLGPAGGMSAPAAWIPAVAGAAFTYYALNVTLVVGAMAAASGRPAPDVFRDGFGYGWELATTTALCVLAVPAALGIEGAGLWAAAAGAPLLWAMRRAGEALVRRHAH